MKLQQNAGEDFKKVAVTEGFGEITYGMEFYDHLNADTLTVEWVEENALWLQFDDEADEEYELFLHYVNLPIDKWAVKDMYVSYDGDLSALMTDNMWKERRMMYLKFQEWLQRRKDEFAQLDEIALFKKNESEILAHTSSSVLTLVRKLQQKIESVDIDDINTRDIPSFIGALAKFQEMASDARARALAVDKLLQLHNEEIDAQLLRQTVAELEGNEEINI